MENPRKPRAKTVTKIDEQLTSEQCQARADGLTKLTPAHPLGAEDLERLEEEIHGKPLHYGSPDVAIEAMERRLATLKAQKAKNVAAQEDCAAPLRQALVADLDQLNREIAATQERLDGYRFQQRHEN